MSRVRRARRIAAAAAFGGGGLTVAGALGWALVRVEAALAQRAIGTSLGRTPPVAAARYGAGADEEVDLVVLGDSTAAGLGAASPEQTPGAIVAGGLAAISGRPVRLVGAAVVGARSEALGAQVDAALEQVAHPHVALVLVGANDVTHWVRPAEAVRHLAGAVTRLRDAGAEVVVGTCPDLGTVEPIAEPLRTLARRASRELAAAQTIAVVEAGGRTVSLGDLLGPAFAARPREMFAVDRFHPSPAGYARVGAAVLPSVCAALGIGLGTPAAAGPADPVPGAPAPVQPVAQAAVQAADAPGTEVVAVQVAGADRGPAGRWSRALWRRRAVLPAGDPGAVRTRTASGAPSS
ncbi:SGNH/GDSL hydrolase family protein [Quadrisphaera sp. DSM 44207]|uniref:SGNH/GDSL hydrolase family protein n=1 Tax=Quadrisphaera sp. DSM 44207 TaxID=1881057 RepID=UPI000B86795C|nr:SGNH/GDSL hydrolase family protein [Quadrisphaera sp. DSM 44207]